jgi:hypothetical protein
MKYCNLCKRMIPEKNITERGHFGWTEDGECLICPGPEQTHAGNPDVYPMVGITSKITGRIIRGGGSEGGVR